MADVRAACDEFAGLHQVTGGVDGQVSLEVSPALAHDTRATIHEAERLWGAVDRPNAMIKIPGTEAGLPAITHCVAAGISVNVTLLFSVERYRAVIEAWLAGLEQRLAEGVPISGRSRSVASFFVSRVDGKVDPLLDRAGHDALRGRIAIANACAAYRLFEWSLGTPRWQRLAQAGARPQRPLWASTSTKDPRYPDTFYVEALVAPRTVNTLPPETFAAYRDHGNPVVRIHEGMAVAPELLKALAAAGIDLAAVTRELEDDGVAKFAASYTGVLGTDRDQGGRAGRGPGPLRMFDRVRRLSLTWWIFIGMVCGIALGEFAPGFAAQLKPLSTVFLRMIKSVVTPIIFGTLVIGIAGHGDDLKRIGRLAVKSLGYFWLMTAVALVIGLTAVHLTQPGVGVILPPPDLNAPIPKAAPTTFGGFLEHIVPTSFFQAAAENEVLQVVFWATLFGIALTQVRGKPRETMLEFCEGLTQVMFRFVGIVMKYAPIGIGAAMAVTVSHSGISVLRNLGLLVATLYGGPDRVRPGGADPDGAHRPDSAPPVRPGGQGSRHHRLHDDQLRRRLFRSRWSG